MTIQKAKKYIEDVQNNRVVVGEFIKLAIDRHVNDLENSVEKGWYFDVKSAQRVFDFFSLIRHAPDKKNWVPFECEPWQAAKVYIQFGWRKATGYRRFTMGYTEIAKKNGKTTFASALANYLLMFDGENEAEIYCAASVERQSKIAFGKAKQMIEKSPALKKRCTILTKNISIESTFSKMEPLGRDSDNIEGVNPHGAIIDEYHVWKNNEVLDNITSATVNRTQAMVEIITTAGKDKTLPCFEFRSMCIDVLKGIKTQDDLFIFIYAMDKDDDWKNPDNWLKANPNFGISIDPEKFHGEFQRALNSPRQEFNFKTKNLNKWVDAPETWIEDELITKCSKCTLTMKDTKILSVDGDITLEDLKNEECHMGIDLASHVDINASSLYYPNLKGRPAALFFFWIPEDKIEEKGDRVDYRVWRDMGLMIVTDGNVIDIDQQVGDLADIIKTFNPETVNFDPAKAYHGVIQGLEKEIDSSILFEYPQGIKYMNLPTRELQRIASKSIIEMFGNPIIRWMFRNAVPYENINDEIKLDKKRSIEKIDGLIALLNAIGSCHFSESESDSHYHTNTEVITL